MYRPVGLVVDSTTNPYTVKATGEKLTPDAAQKYESILLDVTRQRIAIYQNARSQGLGDTEILAALQAFDETLPASYRALVGPCDMTDPSTRYSLATPDELRGGPVQTI